MDECRLHVPFPVRLSRGAYSFFIRSVSTDLISLRFFFFFFQPFSSEREPEKASFIRRTRRENAIAIFKETKSESVFGRRRDTVETFTGEEQFIFRAISLPEISRLTGWVF